MDKSNVKMRWVFVAVLAVFPTVGMICSVGYHDISMLWASLMFAAVAAVVFPVACVLLFLLGQLFSLCLVALLILVPKILGFRKR